MFPRVAGVALAVIGSVLATVRADTAPPDHLSAAPAPLLTSNPTLHASLERIAAGSVLWRMALDEVRRNGRRALIVTPDQVTIEGPADGPSSDARDADLLAEVVPVAAPDSRVETVLVLVNLALLEATYRNTFALPLDVDRDLDRVLVHEIYGHAFPYLLAGNLSGRCADPAPHERATDACSIRRENAVRAELGLGRRTDYSLTGLSLARRGRR